MAHEIVVTVNQISKDYKLYNKPFDRVKEALNPFGSKYHKNFHALTDVSFDLSRGEALGIIGKNGNGKSTLLKIIAGVLTPTKGNVTTKGKIAAILELTSSLKPEMTGIENIHFNLKINGFKSREINTKLEEIKGFADIGEYINQPIKVYSSGMKSRLGFAIATSIEPDILILDEILAVGDFNFKQKCLAKVNEMREQMTIIFVSHSMNSVRLFCDKVIVLEKGKIVFYGKPDEAIKYYLEEEEEKKKELELKRKEIKCKPVKPFYGDLFHNKNVITGVEHFWINKDNKKINKSYTGENIAVCIKFKLLYKPKNLIIGLPIWSSKGEYVTGVSSEMDNVLFTPNNDNQYEIVFRIKNILNPGIFVNIVSVVDGAESLYRGRNVDLEVINVNSRHFGLITINHSWEQNKNSLKDKTLIINNIDFTVDRLDGGGLAYEAKSSYEELNCNLYKQINDQFCPSVVFDIGANYGFTGIVLSKYFTSANVVLVEASERLCRYIDKNMKQNGFANFKIINAICAEENNQYREFSLNPRSSQDNRVIDESNRWEKHPSSTITLNKLFEENRSDFYFIKIDTQGYEEYVFQGGDDFLCHHSNWLIKTEFAPYWLKSQGTDPAEFLKSIVEKYEVVERPLRTTYFGSSMGSIFRNRINASNVESFINYIQQHNKDNRGWCDLFIFPKKLQFVK